jgi:hypothetical protein
VKWDASPREIGRAVIGSVVILFVSSPSRGLPRMPLRADRNLHEGRERPKSLTTTTRHPLPDRLVSFHFVSYQSRETWPCPLAPTRPPGHTAGMRRCRWLFVIPVAVLVAAVVLLRPSGPRPCFATFQRVEQGMTREQVIATVGGPPGDYAEVKHVPSPFGYNIKITHERWESDDGEMYVRFDDDGHAVSVWVYPVEPGSPKSTRADRFPWRLGR